MPTLNQYIEYYARFEPDRLQMMLDCKRNHPEPDAKTGQQIKAIEYLISQLEVTSNA